MQETPAERADVEDSCDGLPTGRGTEEYDEEAPLLASCMLDDWCRKKLTPDLVKKRRDKFCFESVLDSLCTVIDVKGMP